jgi:hypothetical protein
VATSVTPPAVDATATTSLGVESASTAAANTEPKNAGKLAHLEAEFHHFFKNLVIYNALESKKILAWFEERV